jgi:integrase
LRDFRTVIVASLLEQIAFGHKLNRDTLNKTRNVLRAIFTYSISKGHFPARSAEENPAKGVLVPIELASEPEATVAAQPEHVQALLAVFKNQPLVRAAIGLMALGGLRPNEARGLDWLDWDRTQAHLAIKRGVWHAVVGKLKTKRSKAFVTVTDELRSVLLDLWEHQGCPISGFVLAGSRKDKDGKLRPIILDNVVKRQIADTLSCCGVCHKPESAEHKNHEYQRDDSLPTWPGWYAFRRFHATQVCMNADAETAASALRNSKAVTKDHYLKPTTVLPKTRQAVNDAFTGLVQ